MPIRAEYRRFYRPPNWIAVRKRILERAQNRCEQCGKPNGARVLTFTGRLPNGSPIMMWAIDEKGWWYDHHGRTWPTMRVLRPIRSIRVVLTIAHLDHTPGHDDDDNLKALCAWCHLNYDRLHHKETRQTRKDRSRPLLVIAS
jgi:hypothetical protein